MQKNLSIEQIKADLTELCIKISDRHVGSDENKKSTKYASKRLLSAGFSVVNPEFDCIDWKYGNLVFTVGNKKIDGFIGPYSPSYEGESFFETASNIDELSNKNFTGKVAVLHGELCKEQLMPKNFVFYNPEKHKEIIQLLEQKNPLAIVAITSRNPEHAGAWYPFPLIEDGDFHIPSVYLTEKEGEKILSQVNSKIYLRIESQRIQSRGYNVIGTKNGQGCNKIVFCAHIDTKKGTPGALDNGSGVTMLLTLADILKDYRGKLAVEILIVNGEDYYAASGQMLYLAENKDRFNEIVLAVNTDGACYKGYKTAFSCFSCNKIVDKAVRLAFSDDKKFTEIPPWYQSDHMIFVMNQVPAVAVTSQNYIEVMKKIAHTAHDKVKNVDTNQILDIAYSMKKLVYELNDRI